MSNDPGLPIVLAVIFILFIGLFWGYKSNECTNKGGVLTRDFYCIDKNAIK